jgi:hypothetical protein
MAGLYIIQSRLLYPPEFRTLKYYLNLLYVALWNSLHFIVNRNIPDRFQRIVTRLVRRLRYLKNCIRSVGKFYYTAYVIVEF